MIPVTRITLFLALTLAQAPVWAASGDPEAGERAFRPCRTCHIAEPDAEASRAGPNLHGVVDRPAAAQAGVTYSKALITAGAAGLVWDEANFTAYVQDPVGFLRTYLGDPRARGLMLVRAPSPEAARDIFAYLATR